MSGGEYVECDRADDKTARRAWTPPAESGDAGAQNGVGDIFEGGLGGKPDSAAALTGQLEDQTEERVERFTKRPAAVSAPVAANVASFASNKPNTRAPLSSSRSAPELLKLTEEDSVLFYAGHGSRLTQGKSEVDCWLLTTAELAQAAQFEQRPEFKTIKTAGHKVGDFFSCPKNSGRSR